MEFYLNQKSLPMIRKCAHCKFFKPALSACSRMTTYSAYDYTKKTNVRVGLNQYCPLHEFPNEDVLKKEAVVAEFATIQEAMDVINAAKAEKQEKNHNLTRNEDESTHYGN